MLLFHWDYCCRSLKKASCFCAITVHTLVTLFTRGIGANEPVCVSVYMYVYKHVYSQAYLKNMKSYFLSMLPLRSAWWYAMYFWGSNDIMFHGAYTDPPHKHSHNCYAGWVPQVAAPVSRQVVMYNGSKLSSDDRATANSNTTEISIIKYRHMGSLKYASRQTYIEIKCSTLQAPGSRLTRPPSVLHSIKLMAAYRRVYDSHHLQADCKEPGSAPEPYAQ